MTLSRFGTAIASAFAESAEPVPHTLPLSVPGRRDPVRFELLVLDRDLLGLEVAHRDQRLQVRVQGAVADLERGLQFPVRRAVPAERREPLEQLEAEEREDACVQSMRLRQQCEQVSLQSVALHRGPGLAWSRMVFNPWYIYFQTKVISAILAADLCREFPRRGARPGPSHAGPGGCLPRPLMCASSPCTIPLVPRDHAPRQGQGPGGPRVVYPRCPSTAGSGTSSRSATLPTQRDLPPGNERYKMV